MSVDQLESTAPGFVAQLKGILTTQQYKYATILVNQFSKLSFVYLQKKITSAETVMVKQAFEYLQETLVSKFCTTMWTTAALLAMDLFKALNKATKASLTVVSMHTSKMEWQITEVCYLLEVSWQMCHAWITHWTIARTILTMSRRRSTHDERTHGRNAREPHLART